MESSSEKAIGDAGGEKTCTSCKRKLWSGSISGASATGCSTGIGAGMGSASCTGAGTGAAGMSTICPITYRNESVSSAMLKSANQNGRNASYRYLAISNNRSTPVWSQVEGDTRRKSKCGAMHLPKNRKHIHRTSQQGCINGNCKLVWQRQFTRGK